MFESRCALRRADAAWEQLSNNRERRGGRLKAALLAATACGAGLLASSEALAQQQLGEVIVTARKRQESILNVPVIETAITQEQLDRRQTVNIKDLATQVPGLVLGTGTASGGLQVSLRGVGTFTNDPAVDQSIGLFVDGLQFAQGMAYAAAMFDVGQLEVLKGPQSLFYGKSSPGGVISLRTADPTSEAELILRAAYEPEARQRRGEIIISGPISETLKGRLAGMYEKQDGFYYNNAIATPAFGGLNPAHNRIAPTQDYVLRGTLLWNPTSNFDARLKLNSFRLRQINGGAGQTTSCPDGTAGQFLPFLGGVPFIVGDDCKLNRNVPVVDLNPQAFAGLWYDVPLQKVRINFGTLEMNYHFTPELTLTSVTGYQSTHVSSEINGSSSSNAASPIAVQNKNDRKDFTQELRLNSEFSGPLNFTMGAYYQDAYYLALQDLPANTSIFLPPKLQAGHADVHIYSYSVFAQGRWAVTDQLELSAGGRWTDEIRRVRVFSDITGASIPIPVLVPRIDSKPFMPEVTATYRPSDNTTVFASWKKGFKSGSFNGGSIPTPGSDISYGDERVKGFEGGVKSRMFDRTLAVELAGYYYKYGDLQVGTTENDAAGVPVARTVNAGAAKVYGVDFSAAYRPPGVDGLTLSLNGEWNHGEYTKLNNVPCWYGQLISEGCNQQLATVPVQQFTAQDLSHSPMVRAPRWQVNFGFDYEVPVGDGMTVVITNNNNYTSKYLTFPGRRADFFQEGFFKADLSLALRSKDDRWEVAVIGKNITDKITGSNCSAADLANGGFLGPTTFTGTNTRGPAGVAEVSCRLDTGREVWLRLTYKPFS
jgi:iron complex outermembrane receptor protein